MAFYALSTEGHLWSSQVTIAILAYLNHSYGQAVLKSHPTLHTPSPHSREPTADSRQLIQRSDRSEIVATVAWNYTPQTYCKWFCTHQKIHIIPQYGKRSDRQHRIYCRLPYSGIPWGIQLVDGPIRMQTSKSLVGKGIIFLDWKWICTLLGKRLQEGNGFLWYLCSSIELWELH